MADDQGRTPRKRISPEPGTSSNPRPRKTSPGAPIFLPPAAAPPIQPADEPAEAGDDQRPTPTSRQPTPPDDQRPAPNASQPAPPPRRPAHDETQGPASEALTGPATSEKPHIAPTPGQTDTGSTPPTTAGDPSAITASEVSPARPLPTTRTRKTTPAKATKAKATPTKASPAKATPAKATPAKATKAKATPAKASPAKASPTKTTPAKAKAKATKASPTGTTSITAQATTDAPTAQKPTDPGSLPAPEPPESSPPQLAVVTAELLPTEAPLPTFQDLLNRPGQAAELLALGAVSHYGSTAAGTVAALRSTYPNASPLGLARVASLRLLRQARNRGIVSGLGGPLAVLADVVSLQMLHAELVLHIAAAYGHEPRDPGRAADLLVIFGVHADVGTATRAVTTAMEPAQATERKATERKHAEGTDAEREATERQATQPATQPNLARPIVRALTNGILRLGTRRLLSLIPGAGAVIGALANIRATEVIAARATSFYELRTAQETAEGRARQANPPQGA